MSSINILIIIFIYLIFVLFQLNTCQGQCSKERKICDNYTFKCCSGLNCKNTKIRDGQYQYQCFKSGCAKEGNKCDDYGWKCCYGFKCVDAKCKKCTINGRPCNGPSDCCSGLCDKEIAAIPGRPSGPGVPAGHDVPSVGGSQGSKKVCV